MGAAPSTGPQWRQAQAALCHQRPWGHGDVLLLGARRNGPLLPRPQSAVPGGWQGRESVPHPVPQFPLPAEGREPLGDASGAGTPESVKGRLPPPALLSPSPQHRRPSPPSTVGKPFGVREGCVCSSRERKIKTAGAFLQKIIIYFFFRGRG